MNAENYHIHYFRSVIPFFFFLSDAVGINSGANRWRKATRPEMDTHISTSFVAHENVEKKEENKVKHERAARRTHIRIPLIYFILFYYSVQYIFESSNYQL